MPSLDSRIQAVLQTQALASHLQVLGFLLNLKKELPGSESADFIYIGLEINSIQHKAMLSAQRAENFCSSLSQFPLGK